MEFLKAVGETGQNTQQFSLYCALSCLRLGVTNDGACSPVSTCPAYSDWGVVPPSAVLCLNYKQGLFSLENCLMSPGLKQNSEFPLVHLPLFVFCSALHSRSSLFRGWKQRELLDNSCCGCTCIGLVWPSTELDGCGSWAAWKSGFSPPPRFLECMFFVQLSSLSEVPAWIYKWEGQVGLQ